MIDTANSDIIRLYIKYTFESYGLLVMEHDFSSYEDKLKVRYINTYWKLLEIIFISILTNFDEDCHIKFFRRFSNQV